MNILITGVCGFVGSTLARELKAAVDSSSLQLTGVDNLSRPGSESNRVALKELGITVLHGDVRMSTDLEQIGDVDWVIDAAATPSVLAGVDGRTSSRQLVAHNLLGTINLLEFCKTRKAGLILLSTSRVYSIDALAAICVEAVDGAFRLASGAARPSGLSSCGIDETFPTTPPISLYGATKLASETLALDYGAAFAFPVWINRCGVLAGAGQFGRGDQGIFSFWIHSWLRQRPLRYTGFGGEGHQVRDCLHPRDLVPLLRSQMAGGGKSIERVINIGGGIENSFSLAQLSAWCTQRFGPREIAADPAPRPFDVPWVVMDSTRAEKLWGWRPRTRLAALLDEIGAHAERNPRWLEMSA